MKREHFEAMIDSRNDRCMFCSNIGKIKIFRLSKATLVYDSWCKLHHQPIYDLSWVCPNFKRKGELKNG